MQVFVIFGIVFTMSVLSSQLILLSEVFEVGG